MYWRMSVSLPNIMYNENLNNRPRDVTWGQKWRSHSACFNVSQPRKIIVQFWWNNYKFKTHYFQSCRQAKIFLNCICSLFWDRTCFSDLTSSLRVRSFVLPINLCTTTAVRFIWKITHPIYMLRYCEGVLIAKVSYRPEKKLADRWMFCVWSISHFQVLTYKETASFFSSAISFLLVKICSFSLAVILPVLSRNLHTSAFSSAPTNLNYYNHRN